MEERCRRLQWVRGSSGYAGYTLDRVAENNIDIVSVNGETLSLPFSDTDELVRNATQIINWTRVSNPKRGQWAPNIRPRTVPAHQLELV